MNGLQQMAALSLVAVSLIAAAPLAAQTKRDRPRLDPADAY